MEALQPDHGSGAGALTTQGFAIEGGSDDPEFAAALRAATDYRGDVTIGLNDGTRVEGYIYDLDETAMRILPTDGGPRITIDRIRAVRLEFTGRDTAAGKSWDTWVKKYLARQAEQTDACESS